MTRDISICPQCSGEGLMEDWSDFSAEDLFKIVSVPMVQCPTCEGSGRVTYKVIPYKPEEV